MRPDMRRQAVRPWALIYSELSEHPRANSMHGNYLRSHVRMLMVIRVMAVDGRQYDATSGTSQASRPGKIYVDLAPASCTVCRFHRDVATVLATSITGPVARSVGLAGTASGHRQGTAG
jgi:hypothetical protein